MDHAEHTYLAHHRRAVHEYPFGADPPRDSPASCVTIYTRINRCRDAAYSASQRSMIYVRMCV